MDNKKPNQNSTAFVTVREGFTLVEVIFVILIMAILVVSILALFSYSIRLITENKYKNQAVAIAEEKLEIIKNLPYNSVGTVNGIPPGTIPQTESITFNDATYTLQTDIRYIDDPGDGLQGTDPTELTGTDYKKIRISVNWVGPFGAKSAIFISNISPRRNQESDGSGTLSILVFNANGEPVPQAQVEIDATVGTTTIDITSVTNDNGRLILPGAPPGLNAYRVIASKNGYSTDRTCKFDAGGALCTDATGNPQPTKPNASVIADALTEVSFAIDFLSNLNIKTIRQAIPTEWFINTDGTAFDQDNPSMAVCGNGHYIFTWRDYRQNNNPRIFGQKYDQNQIAQWSPDLAITTSNNQNNPDVQPDAACNIYVTWNDDRNGNQDVYFNKYDSAGAEAWGGSKKLNTQSESADQTYPQLIVNASSTHEYIVFLDSRNDANDIYANRIDTAGTAVWANEIKINSDATTAAQGLPKIKMDGLENIFYAWHDNRNGHNDIYAQSTNPAGTKLWGQDIKINTDPSSFDQKNADFVVTSDNFLYLVWQDNKNGHYDIYAQKYDTTGTKIWSEDVKINSDTQSAVQENPVIVQDQNNNFYIVWDDTRNGTSDIYMQKIDSSGTKLIPFDVKINSNTAAEQENPDIYVNAAGQLVVSWQDNSDGDYDIRATVYGQDPQTITPVPNVPLNLVGIKRIGENPIIYKFNNSYTTNGSGDAAVNNIEWDTYAVTATGFTILGTEPVQPFPLDPNQTINLYVNLE